MRKKKLILFTIVLSLIYSGCAIDEKVNIENNKGIDNNIEYEPNPNIYEKRNEVIGINRDNKIIAPEYGNLPGNIINGGYMISYGNYIYFIYEPLNLNGVLFRYDVTSSETSVISKECYGSLNIWNNRLFYTNHDGIFSCDLNGENIDQHYQSKNSQCTFIIYDDSIYLIDSYIYKIDILTKQVQQLNYIYSNYLNITKDKIYYTSQEAFSDEYIENMLDSGFGIEGNLYQMSLDGSDNKMINGKIVANLILFEDFLYYISLDSGLIEKFDTTSLEVEKICNASYFNFNISSEKMYASNATGIDVINIDDGQLNEHYSIEPSPRDTFLNIIDQFVFFLRFGESKIYWLNLNTAECNVFYET